MNMSSVTGLKEFADENHKCERENQPQVKAKFTISKITLQVTMNSSPMKTKIDSSQKHKENDNIFKNKMTYLVNEKCIKCKLTDCVEVCPVDCFYEGKNMLVIKPDECIDCGVCEPECPLEAIVPDTEDGNEKWLELNEKYSEIWPNITEKKDPPQDSDKFKNEKDKFQKYFGENI